MSWRSRMLVEGEDVPDVVVDDEDLAPGQGGGALVESPQDLPLPLGQAAERLVQPEGALVQEPLRRGHRDHRDIAAPRFSRRSTCSLHSAGPYAITGMSRTVSNGVSTSADPLVGPGGQHEAVDAVGAEPLRGLRKARQREHVDVRRGEERRQCVPRRRVRMDDDEILLGPLDEVPQALERGEQLFAGPDRLAQGRDRPQQAAARQIVAGGDDLHRDVTAIEVVLEAIEDAPAVDVGQGDVERDRGGSVLAGEGQRGGPECGDQGLEARVPGRVDQEPGEPQVVLDDQERAVPGLDDVTVVVDLVLDRAPARSLVPPRPGPPARSTEPAGGPDEASSAGRTRAAGGG